MQPQEGFQYGCIAAALPSNVQICALQMAILAMVL
jgi:hypothetical protein